MAVSYTQLPDFSQFVQTYFVDRITLNSLEPTGGSIEVTTLDEEILADEPAGPAATGDSGDQSENTGLYSLG